MNSRFHGIPNDVQRVVMGYLTCCEKKAFAEAHFSKIDSGCNVPSWSHNQCVNAHPSRFVLIVHAIATKEPGYHSISFQTKKEREDFEMWIRLNGLKEYTERYVRDGKRMWKTLPVWEYDAWQVTASHHPM